MSRLSDKLLIAYNTCMIESFFVFLGNTVMMIIKFIIFLLLSLVVVPSMLVMAFLHGPWESMLDSVIRLNDMK